MNTVGVAGRLRVRPFRRLRLHADEGWDARPVNPRGSASAPSALSSRASRSSAGLCAAGRHNRERPRAALTLSCADVLGTSKLIDDGHLHGGNVPRVGAK